MHNAKGRSKVTRVRLDQTESEPELARYLCFRYFRPGTTTQGALGRVNRHWQQTNTASRPQWPVLMPWQRALPPVLLRGLLAMLFFRCPAHRVQPLYAPPRDLQRGGTVFFFSQGSGLDLRYDLVEKDAAGCMRRTRGGHVARSANKSHPR
jgi:hypothetical protein